MASSSSSLLQFLFTLFFLGALWTAPSRAVVKSDNLIEQTCKTTPYYDVCLSTLRSDPTSAQADTKGLAMIMLNAAAAAANSTASYVSTQILRSSSSSSTGGSSVAAAAARNKALRLCAQKYGSATSSAQSSLQDVAAEMYDYAGVKAAAIAGYATSCRNAFGRAAVAYPAELAVREENLKRICAVAVGILDALNSSSEVIEMS